MILAIKFAHVIYYMTFLVHDTASLKVNEMNKDQIKAMLIGYLVPIFLCAYYFTGVIGFYYLAASLIVVMTLAGSLVLAGLLFLINSKIDIVGKTGPRSPLPNMYMMGLARIVTISTIMYLVWSGHVIIGVIETLALIMSILTMHIVRKIYAMKASS